jgi:transcriptional regulator with XRE-family HTH domain
MGTAGRVTQAMQSQWERGAQQPSLPSLEAFLQAVGFGVEQLLWALELCVQGGEGRRGFRLRCARLPVPVAPLRPAAVVREEVMAVRLERLEARLLALENIVKVNRRREAAS